MGDKCGAFCAVFWGWGLPTTGSGVFAPAPARIRIRACAKLTSAPGAGATGSWLLSAVPALWFPQCLVYLQPLLTKSSSRWQDASRDRFLGRAWSPCPSDLRRSPPLTLRGGRGTLPHAALLPPALASHFIVFPGKNHFTVPAYSRGPA